MMLLNRRAPRKLTMKKFRSGKAKNSRGEPRGGHRSKARPDPRGPRPPTRPAQAPQNRVPEGRIVVGIHAVKELLKIRPAAVSQLWLREKFADHAELSQIHETAQKAKIRIETKLPTALDRIISSHQGVVAFSQEQPEIDWQELATAENAILIALDEVEDPHNLGAVMRTAWLFGAMGILLPEHRSADLSPAVSKVAQGAAEHIAVEKDNALPQQLDRLKEMGFWILGLSHKGKQSLFSLEIPKKVVWVLGSESGGLRKSVEGVCDDFISIPQSNPEASYNVSVAAAVAMAETFRQLGASSQT